MTGTRGTNFTVLTAAATWIASLVAGVAVVTFNPSTPHAGDVPWHGCFDSPAAAQEAGPGPVEALERVEVQHREAVRLAGLHRSALDLLLEDPRWKDDGQTEALQEAVTATRGLVERYQSQVDAAVATVGCLAGEL